MKTISQIQILLVFLYSCGPMGYSTNDVTAVNALTEEQLAHIEQKDKLEEIVQKDLVTKDADGNVTDLEGFEKATALDGNENASEQDLREMYANEESIFEFTPPEGVKAEFSAPAMVTGASLSLTDNTSSCQGLDYQEEEPSYKEIIDSAAGRNICGSVSINFCIRMLPVVLKKKGDYVYTETPSFSFDIPCKSDSFKDISISIADGQTSTENSAEPVSIEAPSIVSHIYLTNSSECSTGGEWEAISSETRQWGLDFINGIATVYAKFRDIFGQVSECVSDSISKSKDNKKTKENLDTILPSQISISINDGDFYTSSISVQLSLTAIGATYMYISDSEGCSSGGEWEAFTTSKAWVLEQTNGTSNVYAKFKDDADNESHCIGDSIVHDDTAPSAPATINDGERMTVAKTSPSITWDASVDKGSGISHYEIAIRNAADDSEVLEFTNVGNFSSPDSETMVWTIDDNDIYSFYAVVRAIDNSGNISSETLGDGFYAKHIDTLVSKIVPDDYNNEFGVSISLSADYLAVGAPGSNENGFNRGSVYVYDLANANQVTKITASDGTDHDKFGQVIALSGNTLFVGSDGDDDNGSNSGSVYVYDLANSNQETKIIASDGDANDRFGVSLAVSENLLAVGAYLDEDNGSNSGSVYVYDLANSNQETKIIASDGTDHDTFGQVIALSGNTLAVGVRNDDDNGASSGSVYIYDLANANQETKITASDGTVADYFGESVALSGNTLAVGAKYVDDNGLNSGAVYVYDLANSNQEIKITAFDGNEQDQFGSKIALSGNILVVGAQLDDDQGESSGSVYVYDLDQPGAETKITASEGASYDEFGLSISLFGKTLAVGSYSNPEILLGGPPPPDRRGFIEIFQ